MYYNSLAISLTKKCNAKCDICGVSAYHLGAEGESLDAFLLEKIVNDLMYISQIKNIIFTGGEPFLYVEKIEEIVPKLNRIGKKTGCITNGLYFGDKDKAKKTIKSLSNHGFNFLQISTDQYHLKYVDLECISNAIRICKKYGIEVVLKVGTTKEDKTYEKIIEKLDRERYDVKIQLYPFIPVGEAEKMCVDIFDLSTLDNLELSCRHSTTLFIDETGNIFPCCFFSKPKSLILGNIRDITVKEAIYLARETMIYKDIYLGGFNKMVDLLIKENKLRKADKFYDVCHLCNTILDKDEIINYLQQYYNKDLIK